MSKPRTQEELDAQFREDSDAGAYADYHWKREQERGWPMPSSPGSAPDGRQIQDEWDGKFKPRHHVIIDKEEK